MEGVVEIPVSSAGWLRFLALFSFWVNQLVKVAVFHLTVLAACLKNAKSDRLTLGQHPSLWVNPLHFLVCHRRYVVAYVH